GDQDPVTPLSWQQHIAAGIAGSRIRIIPETAHMTMLESPAAFNTALLEIFGSPRPCPTIDKEMTDMNNQHPSSSAIPDFLRVVVKDEAPADDRVVAEQAVLALNSSMLTLYDTSLEIFKKNMRDQVPIILALFSGQGGNLILYRPGHDAEVAPSVPIVYQLAKSVGHSSMAVYQIVVPYVTNPSANQSWRGPLKVYRTQNQTALDGLSALDISSDDQTVLRAILERNVAFMDDCLRAGTFTYESVEKFIRDCSPWSVKTIGIAASAQVGHWMNVLEGWQQRLGEDWEKAYAVSNSLYVARQNNILFSVLVQFMGTETMGDRLLLIETPEFETTPDKMIDVLTRIVADRSLGMVFFKDYFLMDVELLGGGGRAAIEREMAKRGRKALLPTLAPFRSNDWPWKTDPAKGTGPSRLEDVQ
ncbi:MAG: hypothetical protein JO191_11495, partial [Mycobacteriaceae bacterium]|nr:hypothetical protein [Mycobacteriaceae bacterium]